MSSAILLGTLAVLSFIVQPAEVEGLTLDLKLSDSAANALVGYEMTGIAVTTIILAIIGHRWNWRHLLVISLVVGVFGDLLSAAFTHSPLLAAGRAISGLGHGGLISLSLGAGPILSGYIIDLAGYRLVKQACVLLFALSYFAMLAPLVRHRLALREAVA
ncbi:MAG: MFS transporter [Novosphingobium sp.]